MSGVSTNDRSEIRQFGTDLAALRNEVGGPSYQRLHNAAKTLVKSPASVNTLRNATIGKWLPALSTVIQFVRACDLVAKEDHVVVPEPARFAVPTWQDRWFKLKELGTETAEVAQEAAKSDPGATRPTSAEAPLADAVGRESEPDEEPGAAWQWYRHANDHRQRQVDRFRLLLEDDSFFQEEASARYPMQRREAVWQSFFEENPWIFGFAPTDQIWMSTSREVFEHICADWSEGERTSEATFRASRRIKTLVFVETKTHTLDLLSKRPYRAGCWAPSQELSGSVAQLQNAVDRAVSYIGERFQIDTRGLRPRSRLIIGSLSALRDEGGVVNEERLRSFELFRRQLVEPEVLTFDELLAQAGSLVFQETPPE